jgi:predicted RNA-binding Zn ribbon-like protein
MNTRPEPFFIADHRALDFLNTVAAPAGEVIDWISNGEDLLLWLEKAGVVDRATATRYRSRALDGVAADSRALREWLRGFVQRHAGRPLRPDAIKELGKLNDLLARDDQHGVIEVDRSVEQPLVWRHARRWKSADQLLQPIAEAIADLVCNVDFRSVRECEGPTCTLMFYDRSKTHGRRWCTMAVCGNRAKAAAHRARVKSGAR